MTAGLEHVTFNATDTTAKYLLFKNCANIYVGWYKCEAGRCWLGEGVQGWGGVPAASLSWSLPQGFLLQGADQGRINPRISGGEGRQNLPLSYFCAW